MTNILSIGKNKGYSKSGFLVKGIFLALLSVFFLLLSPNKIYAAVSCLRGGGADAIDYRDSIGALDFGIFNRPVSIDFSITGVDSSIQILERYVSDGQGGWLAPDTVATGFVDSLYKTVTYTNTSQVDYTVGGAWVYRDSSGLTKNIVCSSCLRMFDTREYKSFGTTVVNFPNNPTVEINGSKPFVGFTRGSSLISGGNFGYWIRRDIPPFDYWSNNIYSWGWKARETDAGGYLYSHSAFDTNEVWNDQGYYFAYLRYPVLLPNAIHFDLKSAQFSPGEGSGSHADFAFNDLFIYSRTLQKNPDGTCGTMSAPPNKSCVGQYFGKPQCDAKADKSKPGACQLNQAFGQVNFSNENDPINYWKWSYCYGSVTTATPSTTLTPTTIVPTSTPVPTVAVPTQTPTPVSTTKTCLGQYFGKWQCDTRADKSKPGSCQLNPAFGQINPANENDPINYWKWSYCLK